MSCEELPRDSLDLQKPPAMFTGEWAWQHLQWTMSRPILFLRQTVEGITPVTRPECLNSTLDVINPPGAPGFARLLDCRRALLWLHAAELPAEVDMWACPDRPSLDCPGVARKL